jgi:hypothetical protein
MLASGSTDYTRQLPSAAKTPIQDQHARNEAQGTLERDLQNKEPSLSTYSSYSENIRSVRRSAGSGINPLSHHFERVRY